MTDRDLALEAMRELGWTVERMQRGPQVIWKFSRRDKEDGLFDVVNRKDADIGIEMVADIAMAHGDADDTAEIIRVTKRTWFVSRFEKLLLSGDATE